MLHPHSIPCMRADGGRGAAVPPPPQCPMGSVCSGEVPGGMKGHRMLCWGRWHRAAAPVGWRVTKQHWRGVRGGFSQFPSCQHVQGSGRALSRAWSCT